MVPQPVLAVVLLFPITAVSDACKESLLAQIDAEGQVPYLPAAVNHSAHELILLQLSPGV